MKKINRRTFVRQSGWIAFVVSLYGPVSILSAEAKAGCSTTDDILGPYYRAKAPMRKDLRPKDEKDPLLEVSGIVFKEDCTTRLKDVQIEIWQANPKGEYDNSSAEFLYRTTLKTAADGKYGIQTVIPGRYLSGGKLRPSHIHFRVRAIGYREIISQIYFKDDPYIKTDPWASKPKAESRILVLEPTQEGHSVKFDIFMQPDNDKVG
jgi:catechol 1,2-dioxygenase